MPAGPSGYQNHDYIEIANSVKDKIFYKFPRLQKCIALILRVDDDDIVEHGGLRQGLQLNPVHPGDIVLEHPVDGSGTAGAAAEHDGLAFEQSDLSKADRL